MLKEHTNITFDPQQQSTPLKKPAGSTHTTHRHHPLMNHKTVAQDREGSKSWQSIEKCIVEPIKPRIPNITPKATNKTDTTQDLTIDHEIAMIEWQILELRQIPLTNKLSSRTALPTPLMSPILPLSRSRHTIHPTTKQYPSPHQYQ